MPKYKLFVSHYGLGDYHPLSPFESIEDAAEQAVWSIQNNECCPLRIEDDGGNIVWFNVLGCIDCYHELLGFARMGDDE